MVRSKHRETVRASFSQVSLPKRGRDGQEDDEPEGQMRHKHYSDPLRQTRGALPYLTSGTVTELSAMLVDRIIYQTSKTKHLTFLLSTGNSQRKKKAQKLSKSFLM